MRAVDSIPGGLRPQPNSAYILVCLKFASSFFSRTFAVLEAASCSGHGGLSVADRTDAKKETTLSLVAYLRVRSRIMVLSGSSRVRRPSRSQDEVDAEPAQDVPKGLGPVCLLS